MTGRRDPTPNAADLRALAERDGPVLSLFVPVTAAVPDAAQNAVRSSRVVAAGLDRWRRLGADPNQIEHAEEALAAFAQESERPAPRVASRAAFWSADAGLRTFGLPNACAENACLATAARLREVARAAQRPERYRVLVLSANRVALFEGDEDTLEPVAASGLPVDLEDALGGQLTEPSLQFHSGGGGGTDPIYHGQGGARRGRRVDLERFHHRVARALEDEIGEDVVPLVLAADAQHRPSLEQALSRDVGLLATTLEGNADHLTPSALHAATWPLVAPHAGDARETLEQAREGRHAIVTHLSELVSQAVMGRIRRLWVPEAGHIPGRVDPMRGSAAEAWGDDDLIDGLVAQVLRRGGDVEVIAGAGFPEDRDCFAAELR